MTDARAPGADDSCPWPDCPTCGKPVASVTVNGPTDGTAHPCGCHLWPGTFDEPRLE